MSKQSRLLYDIHNVFGSPLEESTVVYTVFPNLFVKNEVSYSKETLLIHQGVEKFIQEMKASGNTEQVFPTCDQPCFIFPLLAIKLFLLEWKQNTFYFEREV